MPAPAVAVVLMALAQVGPAPDPAAATPPAAETSREAGPLSINDTLRRAKNEYAYGNYLVAVDLLRGLLYPMRLFSDEQVIDARRYLGLALYLLDRKGEARDEFTKLLFLDPDYELDPFTVAPPIVDLFEQVRREHQPELDVIRERKTSATVQTQPQGFKRTVLIHATERSDIATFMPFGVGQFVNGDIAWGIVFAAVELVALGLNVGSWVFLRTRQGDVLEQEAELVQALVITQFASAALFGVTWSLGIFHARLNFIPSSERRTVTDEPLGAPGAAAGPATGLNLRVRF